MAQAVRDEAEALCRRWSDRHDLPEAATRPDIVIGSFRQLLDTELGRLRPDLIALGAHTRSGPALYSLGRATAELVREPPADLLIARRRA